MKTLSYRAASEFLEFLEAWDIQATDMFSRRDLARAEKYREIVKVDKGDCIDTDDVSDRIDSSLSGMSCPCSSFKTCRSIDGLQYCLSYLLLDRIEDTLDSPCIPESLPKPPPSQCNELSDQARKDIEEAISDTIGRVDTFLKSAGSEKSEGADKESALAERATCAESRLVTNKEIAEWRSTHVLFAIRQRLQFCKGLFQSYLTAITGTEENPSLLSLRKQLGDDDAVLFLGAIDPQCLPLHSRIDPNIRISMVEAIQAYCEVLQSKGDSSQLKIIEALKRTINDIGRRQLDPMTPSSNNHIQDNSSKELAKSLATVIRDGQLPKHMRLLQWEVLLRDIHEEAITRKFSYSITSQAKNLNLNEDLLSSVTQKFLLGLSDCALILTESVETDRGEEALKNIKPEEEPFKHWRHESQVAAHKCFQKILPLVQRLNPNAFDDLIHTFGRRRSRKHLPLNFAESSIVLEDGEMTFLSILWMMRSHVDRHEKVELQPFDRGLSVSRLKNEVLKATEEAENRKWWALTESDDGTLLPIDQLRFLYQLGLGMFVPGKGKVTGRVAEWEVVTTQRASSFVQWLRKTALTVRKQYSSMVEKLEKLKREKDEKEPDTCDTAEAALLKIRRLWDTVSSITCNSSKEEIWRLLEPVSAPLLDETFSDQNRKWGWNAIIQNIIPCLPIKEYNYDAEERRWIVLLICFFLSDAPSAMFREWLEQKAYSGKGMTLGKAMEFFMPCSSWWVLLATLPKGGFRRTNCKDKADGARIPPHCDQIIDRLCRSPYFPLEFLYRMYQPYPIQLLIMAQGYTPAPDFLNDNEDLIEEVPSALAFTTIAGWLPVTTWSRHFLENQCDDSWQKEDYDIGAHVPISLNWLSPFLDMGENLSVAFAMPEIYEKAKRRGREESEANFAHIVRGWIDIIGSDRKFPELSLRSRFAWNEIAIFLSAWETTSFSPKPAVEVLPDELLECTVYAALERVRLRVESIRSIIEKALDAGENKILKQKCYIVDFDSREQGSLYCQLLDYLIRERISAERLESKWWHPVRAILGVALTQALFHAVLARCWFETSAIEDVLKLTVDSEKRKIRIMNLNIRSLSDGAYECAKTEEWMTMNRIARKIDEVMDFSWSWNACMVLEGQSWTSVEFRFE